MKHYLIIDHVSGTQLTSKDFLQLINSQSSVEASISSQDFIPYIVQLIQGLLEHRTITVVDDPITGLESGKATLCHLDIRSMEDLVTQLLESKGQIRMATSGTSGQSKWYTHTFQSFIQNLRIGQAYQHHRWMMTYHPAHIGGLQVFFQALLNQNKLVYAFRAKRLDLLKAIAQYDISHLSATPTFFRMLLPINERFPKVERLSFSGERFETKLSEELKRAFPNAKINNIYSTTESGILFVSKDDCFQLSKTLRSLIKVEDDQLFLHNCLLRKSGTLNQEDLWHATGDYVEWIDATHFKIQSRKSDWINVAGYRVHLLEIESCILAIPGIVNCRVFTKKNGLTQNLVCCEIIISNASNLTEKSIKRQLSESLPAYKMPRIIRFVQSIQLSATGKK